MIYYRKRKASEIELQGGKALWEEKIKKAKIEASNIRRDMIELRSKWVGERIKMAIEYVYKHQNPMHFKRNSIVAIPDHELGRVMHDKLGFESVHLFRLSKDRKWEYVDYYKQIKARPTPESKALAEN